MPPGGIVTAVSSSPGHTFSKPTRAAIELRTGLGVAGDAHLGDRVQHRSRVARDPSQPNLRQVHLIHAELHDELLAAGFTVTPGDMGENVTTRGIDLLGLPTGTKLAIGDSAVVQITGLRNPCRQIDNFQHGLLREVLDKDANGTVIRRAGIMGIVLVDGTVAPGDPVHVELPHRPHEPLRPV